MAYIPTKEEVADWIASLENTKKENPELTDDDLKIHPSINIPNEKDEFDKAIETGGWEKEKSSFTLTELIELQKTM